MKTPSFGKFSRRYPPKWFSVWAVACLVASFHVSGCSKLEESSGTGMMKNEVGQRTEIHPLVGSRWKLVDVRNFADVASEPLPRMEIKFGKARIEIVICNRIEADYALHLDAELHLTKLVATEMHCNARTAKLESFIMSKRILYNYDKDILTLHNGMGPMLLLKPTEGN